MNCRKVRRTVFLYVDREMDDDLLVSYREHLEICPGCAREIAYTVRLLTLVRKRCARATAPERLRERILTSFPHRHG